MSYNEFTLKSDKFVSNLMDILLTSIAASLYLLALILIIPGLSGPNQIPTKYVFISACAALIIHAYILFELVFSAQGENLSILNVASVISLIVAAFTTAFMFRLRIWVFFPVVYSFCAINLTAATLAPDSIFMQFTARPEWLIHISLALFSYAILVIAALYALQLAWLNRQLKVKKSGLINPNLPPLMAVERQLFTVILIGESLLTITLISGYLFVGDMFAEGKAHKVILSSTAWLVYAVLLFGHYKFGWRGRTAITFNILGVVLLTLGYFGSRIVQEFIIAS